MSNISLLRRIFGTLTGTEDGKRNTWEIFKYPSSISFSNYYLKYRRNSIANRVITSIPESCWRDGFTFGEENEKREQLLKSLSKINLVQKLEKADKLNRIGKYSVLFVGVPDGLDPREPIGTINPAHIDSIYFQPFSEDGSTISRYETDVKSERYNMPLIYSLRVSADDKELNAQYTSKEVHWTRVVHFAEGGLDSDIEGMSSLESIYNDLLDLEKVTGGSAEAYFRNARGKYHFNGQPGFMQDLSEEQKTAMADQSEAFANNWQDFIRTQGVDVNALTTPHADPKPTRDCIISNISAQTKIPLRVLTGEGGGNYSGGSDRDSFNQVVQDRQKSFCAEKVYRVLEILEMCGAIEPLGADEEVIFPPIDALTETEKKDQQQKQADIAQKLSQALADNSGLNGHVDIRDLFEKCGLKYSEEV